MSKILILLLTFLAFQLRLFAQTELSLTLFFSGFVQGAFEPCG